MNTRTSWVTLALDKHTSRSQGETLRQLEKWLGRNIAGWQINLLLQLRGSAIDEESLRAISEIGVEPEDSPEAVKLHKHAPFQTMYFDGTPSGTYKWNEFVNLSGKKVFVADGDVDANKAHKLWRSDKNAVIVDTSPSIASRLRSVFGWEKL